MLMEPALQIKLVRENLALAISLWSAARGRSITAADLAKQVIVTSPLELKGDDDLVRYIANQVRAAFAFSVIQTNRTLELVYGYSPLQASTPDLQAARCAIYLLDKALNQDLLEPVWACPPEYRRRLEVQPIAFAMDATTLEGKAVSWDDFGGLEKYLKLLEYCSSVVERAHTRPHPADEQIEAAPTSAGPFQPSPPQEEVEAIHDLPLPSEQADPLARFIATCCAVDPAALTIAKDLYASYLTWCRENGETPMVQRSFGMQLTKRGFQRRRRGRGRHWWQGIGLAN
jgi:hypothetical protein